MSAPTPPLLDSLRRQLEGRWERIEQARERYTLLTRQLGSSQWKRALRGQPEPLKQTVARAAPGARRGHQPGVPPSRDPRGAQALGLGVFGPHVCFPMVPLFLAFSSKKKQ